MSILKVKRTHPNAVLPSRTYITDAGLDLSSVETLEIPPGEWKLIETGIAIALPLGGYGRIAPRSGLAAKNGIFVNGGVVDFGYTQSLKVILYNASKVPFQVVSGDRIAQLIVEQILLPTVVEVDELDDTDRGTKGFGSSGV